MKYITLTILLLSSTANAAGLSAVPSEWRLQQYVNSTMVVYHAVPDSICNNGRLAFNNATREEDKKLFWSTVMAAKLSKQKLFLYYDDTSSSNCIITSFGLEKG